MTLVENKFTISKDEESEVTDRVAQIIDTFPTNIAYHIITDMKIELTGLYTLMVCNDYLKSLPPGIGGNVLVGGYQFAIIKLEEDLLISPL